MSRRSIPFAWMLAAFVACESKPDPAPSRVSQSAAAAPVSASASAFPAPVPSVAVPPAPPKVDVDVVDAGAEPREPLRYHLAKGSRDSVTSTVTPRTKVEMDGQQMPQQSPPTTTMHLEFEVIGLDGTVATVRRSVADVGFGQTQAAPGGGARALTAFQQALRGFEVLFTFSSRGETSAPVVNASKLEGSNLGPMLGALTQALGQLATVLPDEPVGKGAVWRVTGDLEVGGMRMTQVVTTKLVALRVGELDVEVDVAQTGKPGPMAPLGLPRNAPTPTLISMKGKGAGKLTVKLDKPLGTGKMSTTSDVVLSVAGPAGSQRIETRTVLEIATERATDSESAAAGAVATASSPPGAPVRPPASGAGPASPSSVK